MGLEWRTKFKKNLENGLEVVLYNMSGNNIVRSGMQEDVNNLKGACGVFLFRQKSHNSPHLRTAGTRVEELRT